MNATFGTLARWTSWGNRRLYDACAELTADEYYQARPCAFGSIHRTLNHLLATDKIWLGRLSGEGHSIPSLDHEVCFTFDALRVARLEEDQRIVRVIDGLVTAGILENFLHYESMDGRPQQMPIGLVLSHLFLHHAHHRGQAHALLSQTPVASPSMDLTYFPRD